MEERRKRRGRYCTSEKDRLVRYRTEDIEFLRQQYSPGDSIYVMKDMLDEKSIVQKVRRRFTVVELFRFHVSCVDENGFRESFGYFELEAIKVA